MKGNVSISQESKGSAEISYEKLLGSAVNEFHELVERHPQGPPSLFGQEEWKYLVQRMFSEAIAKCNQAIALEPN